MNSDFTIDEYKSESCGLALLSGLCLETGSEVGLTGTDNSLMGRKGGKPKDYPLAVYNNQAQFRRRIYSVSFNQLQPSSRDPLSKDVTMQTDAPFR